MATVGSIVFEFAAATAGYFAGSKSVKDDAGSVSGAFAGVGGSIAGLFVGIGAALSAGALIEGLKHAGEEVVNLAHDAEKLSVSTEELSRFRFAAKEAGVDAESLSHAMLKMQVEIGKAATEGGEAAAKIEAFGFNVKQLASEDPAKQFSEITAKLSAIHNPAERAAAEVALFGKSGAELGPLFKLGADGISKLASEADKLGVTMSSVDAESTLRASRAVDKVSEAVSGIGQHIASKLAPNVEDIANRMIAWAETGNHVGTIINGVMTGIEYSAAFVADVFQLVKGSIEIAAGIGIAALIPLTAAVEGVARAGAWLLNHVFGAKIDTSGIEGATANMIQRAHDLVAAGGHDIADVFGGGPAAAVFKYFDGVSAAANKASAEAVKAHEATAGAFDVGDAADNIKKITEKLAEMHKAVDEFGMSEGAKKLHELQLLGANEKQIAEAKALADKLDGLKKEADIKKELAELDKQARQAGMDEAGKKVDDLREKGATAEQIAKAQELQKQIEAANKQKEEAKRLDDEAKKAKEDALTPLEKEREKILELQKLYQSGRISKEQFASAAAKAEAEVHGEEHHTQKAVTRGSEAAFALMNEINKRAMGGGDKKEQIAAAQLRSTDKATQYLAQLLNRLTPKPQTQTKLGVV